VVPDWSRQQRVGVYDWAMSCRRLVRAYHLVDSRNKRANAALRSMLTRISKQLFHRRFAVGRATLALVVTTVMAACSAAYGGSQTSTASAARTTPSAQRMACKPPASTGDETANWVTYVNPIYGYCLKYPATWVRERLSTDDQPAFASEQSGGPLGLSANGIYFDVYVSNSSPSDCPRTNTHGFTDGAASGTRYLISPTSTTVDGASGVRFDGASVVVVNVWHVRCYDLWFAVGSYPAMDAHRHVINLILGSFRFGT